MTATHHPIDIDQGATFRAAITYATPGPPGPDGQPTYTPYDLTGCTALCEIREAPGLDILASMSTAPGGGITLGGPTGQITLAMPATKTAGIDVQKAAYDLRITWPSGDVTRVIQGPVRVSLAITTGVPA